MQYKGYISRIKLNDDANIFHGEVINIRDVITFQGKSVDELRKAFEESIDDYLDFCSKRGEEPDRPYSGRFTVQLSPEQHRKVVLAAENSGKDRGTWVSDILAHATG